MQLGREQLAAWRERSKLKQYELARLLEITDAYLSQVLSGKRRPSLLIAVRIERETGIPVSSWVPTRLGKAKAAAKSPAAKSNLSGELSRVS